MRVDGLQVDGPLKGGVVPKYRQLLQMLRNSIHSGQLAPGTRLPAAEELTRSFGISRGTVMKALSQLEAERLVRIVQGVGSFVESTPPNLTPFRFLREPSGGQARAGGSAYKVLAQEVIPASPSVAERLLIESTTPVIHLERVRLVDGSIVEHTVRYLPESLCPSIATADLSSSPIHDLLVRFSDLPLLRAEIQAEAHDANGQEAHLLQVDPGTPIVVIERLTFTAPHRPAVWYRGLFKDTYWLGMKPDVGER